MTHTPPPARNEVLLHGRVTAPAEARDLPSGDRLVTLRVVVDRPPGPEGTRRVVDAIDVACWTTRTQRGALALKPGAFVGVQGSLRRRFFGAAGGRASRYEVEAHRVARIKATAVSTSTAVS